MATLAEVGRRLDFFVVDVLERLGLLGLERRLGQDLQQANRSPNGWCAMSEDLLPGVSVIDLRVVDYSTLRLETGLDIEISSLACWLKWAQMKYLVQLGWQK